MMLIDRFAAGSRVVLLTGADLSATLEEIRKRGIPMREFMVIDDLTWQFTIDNQYMAKVLRIAEKRGDQCRTVRIYGCVYTLRQVIKRPVLLFGLLMLLALTIWLPSRILFVRVEGNVTLPAALVVESAKQCGICFGATSASIRGETIKNQLLSALPQLQWAGIKTEGCVAYIQVRERSVSEETREEKQTVASLVASRDGIIQNITVTQGNGLCAVGQAVKTGQVLISGYTDCGICIRATKAEGEILAYTQRHLRMIFPTQRRLRVAEKGKIKKISVIFGKNLINFSKCSGISGGTCAKIYSEKCITLPGGFSLPIGILTEEWINYESSTDVMTDCASLVQQLARSYLLGQTVAGNIEHTQESITEADGLCTLDGQYLCLENIGRLRKEESIPNYGKNH